MPRHALADQPTAAPTRKMAATGGAAIATSLVIWVAARGLGLELTEVEAGLIVAGISWMAGYVVKERRAPQPPDRFVVPRQAHDRGVVDMSMIVGALLVVFIVLVILKVAGLL